MKSCICLLIFICGVVLCVFMYGPLCDYFTVNFINSLYVPFQTGALILGEGRDGERQDISILNGTC